MASVDSAGERMASSWARSWSSLAASFLVGALLGGGLIFGALNDQGRQDVANQVVSAHIRALMAPQSFDVASSDRHTVKPWFAGKLAFAPKVVDLSTQGFPLVGARIDVIGLEPVASLVYSKGKHQISVMEMPNPRGLTTQLTQHAEQGYQALSWSDGKITYWVVSDAAVEELKTFVGLFQELAEILSSPSEPSGSIECRKIPVALRTCPLWVMSRHRVTSASCPLFPSKRTFNCAVCTAA